MLIFFDTEFTGLQKNTTLISIGLVDENGRTFYAEFTDYNRGLVDDWVQENVIKNLLKPTLNMDGNNWTITGTKGMITVALIQWLKYYGDSKITLVSDVCYYDMVLFNDLFKNKFDKFNKNICPACYDINQTIHEVLNIPIETAFDLNREELSERLGYKIPENVMKHNSLFDARIIKNIYYGLKNIDLNRDIFALDDEVK